jgi:hypothetical protein
MCTLFHNTTTGQTVGWAMDESQFSTLTDVRDGEKKGALSSSLAKGASGSLPACSVAPEAIVSSLFF